MAPAGGTDLSSKMKQKLVAPEIMISLKSPELWTIRGIEGKGVVLGAKVTYDARGNASCEEAGRSSINTPWGLKTFFDDPPGCSDHFLQHEYIKVW
jgi:hypothetical protein